MRLKGVGQPQKMWRCPCKDLIQDPDGERTRRMMLRATISWFPVGQLVRACVRACRGGGREFARVKLQEPITEQGFSVSHSNLPHTD